MASPVVVVYADHLSDGTREDLAYVARLRAALAAGALGSLAASGRAMRGLLESAARRGLDAIAIARIASASATRGREPHLGAIARLARAMRDSFAAFAVNPIVVATAARADAANRTIAAKTARAPTRANRAI